MKLKIAASVCIIAGAILNGCCTSGECGTTPALEHKVSELDGRNGSNTEAMVELPGRYGALNGSAAIAEHESYGMQKDTFVTGVSKFDRTSLYMLGAGVALTVTWGIITMVWRKR